MFGLKRKYLATITVLLLLSLFNNSNVQAQIVADPTYTSMNITGTGNLTYHATALRYSNNGGIAINRFSNFNLAAGDTANIYLDNGTHQASTSINIIDSPMVVSGVINQYLGSQGLPGNIGGNLMIISPQGITINGLGTINAGSILLSASQTTDTYLTSETPGVPGIQLNDLDYLVNQSNPDLYNSTIYLNALMMFQSNPAVSIGTVRVDGILTTRNLITGTPYTNTYDINDHGILVFGKDITINGSLETGPQRGIGLVAAEQLFFDPTEIAASPARYNTIGGNELSMGRVILNNTSYVSGASSRVHIESNWNTGSLVNVEGAINANALVGSNQAGGIIELISNGVSGGILDIGQAGGAAIELGAKGDGTGAGGVFEIINSQFILNDNASLNASNGPLATNPLTGGRINIIFSNVPNPLLIGDIATLSLFTSDDLTRMTVADVSSNSQLRGRINLRSAVQMDIDTLYNLKSGTDLAFSSGNRINAIGQILSSGTLSFFGSEINVGRVVDPSGTTTATNIPTLLETVDGNILLRPNSSAPSINSYITIDSSSFIRATEIIGLNDPARNDLGTIALYTGKLDEHLHVISDGIFETRIFNTLTGTTTSNAKILYIGKNPDPAAASQTIESVGLTGSSFNSAAEIGFTTDTYIDPVAMQALDPTGTHLLVNGIYIGITTIPTPPDPPTPPTPPTPPPPTPVEPINPVIIEDGEQEISKDISVVTKEADPTPTTQDVLIEPDGSTDTNSAIANSFEPANTDNNEDTTDISGQELINICNNDSCSGLNTDDSLGAVLLETLARGYPIENEYTADKLGVEFSYDANYNPNGLEEFLSSVQRLEEILGSSDNKKNSGHSLFSYKHPPTKTRLEKIENQLKESGFNDKENKKVNRKRFENILKIINQD